MEEERRQRELEQAQQLATEQQQRAEIEQKRATEQQEANKKLRRFSISIFVFLIIAVAAAGVAIYFAQKANRDSRIAEARALAAEANQWLGADEVSRGLALAYQGVTLTHGLDGVVANEAHSALVNSLAQVRANAVLEGHSGIVRSAAFNPEGTRIVTASDDGTARLWDGEGGLITVLEGHTGIVWSAAFNAAGTRIVTASEDGTARLWRVYSTFEEMLTEAERKLRLVLTAAECEQYFAEFDPAFCVGWEE